MIKFINVRLSKEAIVEFKKEFTDIPIEFNEDYVILHEYSENSYKVITN